MPTSAENNNDVDQHVKRSLATSTLLQMGLRITLVVVAVTLLSYWHIVASLENQTSDKLQKYIVERGQRESAIFLLAEDNQKTLQDIFLRSWSNARSTLFRQFDEVFMTMDDGSTRTRPELFSGVIKEDGLISEYISGFVGQQAPLDDEEFRSRLMLSYQMLDHFGPSYKHRFANLYIHMPENVNLVYWPGLPWGLNAKADLDMTLEEWMSIAFIDNNPLRNTVWTGLYYDPTADEWMVSCETPVDYEDQHLVTIGHDILLNNLFDRVFNDQLDGAYNFIMRTDGRLVAHPQKTEELQQAKGVLYVADLQDEKLASLYNQIQAEIQHDGSRGIVENAINKAFVAFAPIQGPDWIFVTVYPKSLLASSAKSAAEFILLLSIVSLIVELVMLHLVLRRQVIKPIDSFVEASQALSAGHYEKARTDIGNLTARQDEMGLMARVFSHMASRIENFQKDLQKSVDSRTQELSLLAEQLRSANTTLEKLTYIDPLTQIANKRQFEEMFDEEWRRASRQRSALHLMMIDIDCFKIYNDTYGHVQGDVCLKKIADTLHKQVTRAGDLVARVGGEEFAILLPNSTHEEALGLGNKLVESVVALNIPHENSDVSKVVTISVGLATAMPNKKHEPVTFIEAADAALYRAKAAGRNRLEK